MLRLNPTVAIAALDPQSSVRHLPRSMQHYPSSSTPVDVGVSLELCSDHMTAFAARSSQLEGARAVDPPAPPPEALRTLVEALSHPCSSRHGSQNPLATQGIPAMT